MDKKVFGIMTCLLFALLFSAFTTPVVAQGGDNHAIYGVVTFDGENVTCNMTLVVTRTNATMTETCDETTGYVFELLNVAPNWAVGDEVEITATYEYGNATYLDTQTITISEEPTQRLDFALESTPAVTPIDWTLIAIVIAIVVVVIIIAVAASKSGAKPE